MQEFTFVISVVCLRTILLAKLLATAHEQNMFKHVN